MGNEKDVYINIFLRSGTVARGVSTVEKMRQLVAAKKEYQRVLAENVKNQKITNFTLTPSLFVSDDGLMCIDLSDVPLIILEGDDTATPSSFAASGMKADVVCGYGDEVHD